MIPVSYYEPSEYTSPKFAYAFAKGCKGTITDEKELFPGPVACFGSPPMWPVLRAAQEAGRDWYYGDHGYWRKGKYYRITKNAYQHDGYGNATPTRFLEHRRPVQPWRSTGSHIVVCPNSAIHFELHGSNVDAWLELVKTTLRECTDREIRVRWKTDRRIRPLSEDLVDAWAVIVYSSASAVEALIAGVPIFTLAPWAATVRMGLSDLRQIERPYLPDDREPFLWNLADNQWTMQEIFEGVAWRLLQNREVRHAA